MSANQQSKLAVADLASQFITAATTQFDTPHLEVDSYNKLARRIFAISEKLRVHGTEGETELLKLLRHRHPNVRLNAAATCLRFASERAAPVLKALSESGQIGIASMAATTLLMWQQGYFSPERKK